MDTLSGSYRASGHSLLRQEVYQSETGQQMVRLVSEMSSEVVLSVSLEEFNDKNKTSTIMNAMLEAHSKAREDASMSLEKESS